MALVTFFCMLEENPAPTDYFQQVLMRCFFAYIDASAMHEISHGDHGSPVCGDTQRSEWDGVRCHSGVVKRITYGKFRGGNFDLAYAPSSVISMLIVNCEQAYQLETRMLPRSLENANIVQNRLFGTVDLTSLPRGLVQIDLSRNGIIGPIYLANLPDTLTEINLRGNAIKQHTIY